VPARGRDLFTRAADAAAAHDARTLPSTRQRLYRGPYGTFPERTRGSYPKAPPLADGPLYRGEWREDISGKSLVLPGNGARVVLASTRRPWPFVGFAVDTSRIAGGLTVTFLLQVCPRGCNAQVVQNVIVGAALPEIVQTGPAAPNPWLAVIGLMPGARVEVVAFLTPTEGTAEVRASLWGYNAPGYGP
jgi:hypothetical protein